MSTKRIILHPSNLHSMHTLAVATILQFKLNCSRNEGRHWWFCTMGFWIATSVISKPILVQWHPKMFLRFSNLFKIYTMLYIPGNATKTSTADGQSFSTEMEEKALIRNRMRRRPPQGVSTGSDRPIAEVHNRTISPFTPPHAQLVRRITTHRCRGRSGLETLISNLDHNHTASCIKYCAYFLVLAGVGAETTCGIVAPGYFLVVAGGLFSHQSGVW